MALEFMKIPGLHKILTAEDFKTFLIGVDKLPDYRGADYSIYRITEDSRALAGKLYYTQVSGIKGGSTYEICSHYQLTFSEHYGPCKPFEYNNVTPLCIQVTKEENDSTDTKYFSIDKEGNATQITNIGIGLNFEKNLYWGYNADSSMMVRLEALTRNSGKDVYLRASRQFQAGQTYARYDTTSGWKDISSTELEELVGTSVAEYEQDSDGRPVYYRACTGAALSTVKLTSFILYNCGGYFGIGEGHSIYDVSYKDGTIYPTAMNSGDKLSTSDIVLTSDVVFQRSKSYFIMEDNPIAEIHTEDGTAFVNYRSPTPNYVKLEIGSEGMGYTAGMSLAQWKRNHAVDGVEPNVYEEKPNHWREIDGFIGTLTREFKWYERHGENFPYVGFVAIATSKWNGQMIGGLYHCVEREYQMTADLEHHFRHDDSNTIFRSKSYYEHHMLEGEDGSLHVNHYVERNGIPIGQRQDGLDESGTSTTSIDGTGLIYRNVDGESYFQAPIETEYIEGKTYYSDQYGAVKTGIVPGAPIPLGSQVYVRDRPFYLDLGDISSGFWKIRPIEETATYGGESGAEVINVTGKYGRTTDTRYRLGQQYYIHDGGGVFSPVKPGEMFTTTSDVYFWYKQAPVGTAFDASRVYGTPSEDGKHIEDLDNTPEMGRSYPGFVDNDGNIGVDNVYIKDVMNPRLDGQEEAIGVAEERYYHVVNDSLHTGLAMFQVFPSVVDGINSPYMGALISGQADTIYENNLEGNLPSNPQICVKFDEYSKYFVKQRIRNVADDTVVDTFVDSGVSWDKRAEYVRPETYQYTDGLGVTYEVSYPTDYEDESDPEVLALMRVDYFDGYLIPSDLSTLVESRNGESILQNAYYEKCHGMYVWQQYFIERRISVTKPYDISCFFKEVTSGGTTHAVLYLKWTDPKFMLHKDDVTQSPDAWARTVVSIKFKLDDDVETTNIQIAGEAGTNDAYSKDYLIVNSQTFERFGSEGLNITNNNWGELRTKLAQGIRHPSAVVTITAVSATGMESHASVKPARLVWTESTNENDYVMQRLVPASDNSVALPGIKYYTTNELGHETMVGDLQPYVSPVGGLHVKFQKDVVTYLFKDGKYTTVTVTNAGLDGGTREGNNIVDPDDGYYCIKVPNIPEITMSQLIRDGQFDQIFANDVTFGGVPLPKPAAGMDVHMVDIDRVELALPIEEGYVDVVDVYPTVSDGAGEDAPVSALIDTRQVGKFYASYRSTNTEVCDTDATRAIGTAGDGVDVAPIPRQCLNSIGETPTAEDFEATEIPVEDQEYYRKVPAHSVFMHSSVIPDAVVRPHYKVFILPNYVKAVGAFVDGEQYYTMNKSTLEFDLIEDLTGWVGQNVDSYTVNGQRVLVYVRDDAAFPSAGDIYADQEYLRRSIEVTTLVDMDVLRSIRIPLYVRTTVPMQEGYSIVYKSVFQQIKPLKHSVTFRFKRCISKRMFEPETASDPVPTNLYWDQSALRTFLNGLDNLPASGSNVNASGTGLATTEQVNYAEYTDFCEHQIARVVNTVHHAEERPAYTEQVTVDPETGEETTVVVEDPDRKTTEIVGTARVVDKFWIPSLSQVGFNYVRSINTEASKPIDAFQSEGACLCAFDTGAANWHLEDGSAARSALPASGSTNCDWLLRSVVDGEYGTIILRSASSYIPVRASKAASQYVSIFFTLA